MFGVIYAEELHWGCAGIALAISAPRRSRRPASPRRARPSRSAAGCPSASASATRSSSAPTPSPRPGAGSDVKSLRTTAKRDGDEWVLNGTKVFISNGGIADVTVVVATVDPELGHRGQASFIVAEGHAGLPMGKKEDKLGIRASQTAELVLDDVPRPDGQPARRPGQARAQARARPLGRARRLLRRAGDVRDHAPDGRRLALGIAAGRLRWTLDRLEGRELDGASGPLLEQQRVQQVLADVATEIDAARLLVQRAAWMGRNGVPMTGGQGSMSKLKAGDVAMWATTALMDLVGPEASLTDHPLEKFFRDAKIYQLFEGTAQVQRLVISRMQVAERRRRARRTRRRPRRTRRTGGATRSARPRTSAA